MSKFKDMSQDARRHEQQHEVHPSEKMKQGHDKSKCHPKKKK